MRFLRRGGAYIRKIARDFVKHRKDPNIHSQPFHSPYDHFGLKKSIIFALDGTSAVIGPRYIRGGLSNVARIHEFGGKALVRDVDPVLMDGVKRGYTAPVTSSYLKKKDVVVRRNGQGDPKTGRPIYWIKIRTESQAKHSTRLYKRMVRKDQRRVLKEYLPRPYMSPALDKAIPYLPLLWRNTVK